MTEGREGQPHRKFRTGAPAEICWLRTLCPRHAPMTPRETGKRHGHEPIARRNVTRSTKGDALSLPWRTRIGEEARKGVMGVVTCPMFVKAAGIRSLLPYRQTEQAAAAARGQMPVVTFPTIARNGTNRPATETAEKVALMTDRRTHHPCLGSQNCTHRHNLTAILPSQNHRRFIHSRHLEGARETCEETGVFSGRMTDGDKIERAVAGKSLTRALKPRQKSAQARTDMVGVVMETV